MEVIHGGRASGKTTIIVLKSAATGIPIMTTEYYMKRLYMCIAENLGVKIPDPIFWNHGHYFSSHGKVLIDNAERTIDYILRTTNGVSCDTMAISSPVIHLPNCFIPNPGVIPEAHKAGSFEFVDAVKVEDSYKKICKV